MGQLRRTVWILGLALFLILSASWHAWCQDSIEITEVFTTDFAGTLKTIFHPGDNVRYNVTFDLIVVEKTKVIAQGKARGQKIRAGGEEVSFKTKLEKQKKRFETGSHVFQWDEKIPINALPGELTYEIRVKVRDDGEDSEFGLLTVEEAPSKIAFQREEVVIVENEAIENKDVWIMNPDGSDQVRLTSDPANDRAPSISPNGMEVAFASDRAGNFDIWILDLETNDLIRLTDDEADDTQPEWSPDGKKIVFTSERGGSKDVWVIDVDSGDTEQVTFSNLKEKGPHWAEKGKRILFVSDKDGNDDIFKMKTNGRKKNQLTFDIGDQRTPMWSEATKEIAFTWWEFSKSRAHIYAMDKDGENVRQLTTKKFYDRGPSWSPDGTRIAFFSNRVGSYDIWTMKADGDDLVQITTDTARETVPDWKKAGFSDERTDELEITGKGKKSILYLGTVHLSEGGALMVEMSWDDAADLDLGVLEPDDTLITWDNPEGFGRHRGNGIPGPGTEVYTLSGAPRGGYRIGAYYKNFPSTAAFRIRWRDGSFEPLVVEAR
jgi:Tol biopolymer transport system component